MSANDKEAEFLHKTRVSLEASTEQLSPEISAALQAARAKALAAPEPSVDWRMLMGFGAGVAATILVVILVAHPFSGGALNSITLTEEEALALSDDAVLDDDWDVYEWMAESDDNISG